MRDAFRSLTRDGWTIGIACAAALAYAGIVFLESGVNFVLALIDGYEVPTDATADFFGAPYAFVFRGHLVSYEGVLNRSILLLVVVPAAALLLQRTRSEDGEPEEPLS